jgi:hypothetical protein
MASRNRCSPSAVAVMYASWTFAPGQDAGIGH